MDPIAFPCIYLLIPTSIPLILPNNQPCVDSMDSCEGPALKPPTDRPPGRVGRGPAATAHGEGVVTTAQGTAEPEGRLTRNGSNEERSGPHSGPHSLLVILSVKLSVVQTLASEARDLRNLLLTTGSVRLVTSTSTFLTLYYLVIQQMLLTKKGRASKYFFGASLKGWTCICVLSWEASAQVERGGVRGLEVQRPSPPERILLNIRTRPTRSPRRPLTRDRPGSKPALKK